MDKKGFTLIELLAVIVIIGIISMIAVPNAMEMYENTNKKNLLSDANNFIALAKEKINANYNLRSLESYTFYLEDLENNNVLANGFNGDNYSELSYVKYLKEGDIITYCVSLIGDKLSIGRNNCVKESELSIQKVVKNN